MNNNIHGLPLACIYRYIPWPFPYEGPVRISEARNLAMLLKKKGSYNDD